MNVMGTLDSFTSSWFALDGMWYMCNCC